MTVSQQYLRSIYDAIRSLNPNGVNTISSAVLSNRELYVDNEITNLDVNMSVYINQRLLKTIYKSYFNMF